MTMPRNASDWAKKPKTSRRRRRKKRDFADGVRAKAKPLGDLLRRPKFRRVAALLVVARRDYGAGVVFPPACASSCARCG